MAFMKTRKVIAKTSELTTVIRIMEGTESFSSPPSLGPNNLLYSVYRGLFTG